MKSLDCNQIKIYISWEIIGEEDKYKKNYIYFLKILKKICNSMQSLGATMAFKLNFYYIVYDFFRIT